jgi:glycerophosphoryl diester phosphodiesterase
LPDSVLDIGIFFPFTHEEAVVLVIAHRGNNKEEFENSFSAYEKSVSCGADRIELDVLVTKDGHAVINHDNHLMHATGKNLYCSQLTRAEIKTLKQQNGDPVPFLDEVVERFLDRIELNIEIKGNNPESARAVREIVGKHRLKEKVIVSSFCLEPLIYMRDYCPDINRACLTGDDEWPWPFFSHAAILNFMQMTSSTTVHPRLGQMSEHFMDQCKARHWKVFTWAPMIGEDQARESWWTMLRSLEVDGHCTNYPTEFILWQKNEASMDNQWTINCGTSLTVTL